MPQLIGSLDQSYNTRMTRMIYLHTQNTNDSIENDPSCSVWYAIYIYVCMAYIYIYGIYMLQVGCCMHRVQRGFYVPSAYMCTALPSEVDPSAWIVTGLEERT